MKRTKTNRRRGATAVEFAFVFPIVLSMFVGSTAVFQAFLLRDTAQYAAYEGARQSLLSDSTVKDVEQKVNETLRIFHVQKARVKIEPNTISESTQEVTVQVSIPFRENAWIAPAFIPQRWRMKSSVTLNRN